MMQRLTTTLSALAVMLPLVTGCGDDPVRPRLEDELSVRLSSAHGVYHHAPGDFIDVDHQEAYYAWLFERMGVEPAEPLVYFKYRDRAHMLELTGENTNGWAEEGTYRFHTIWELDNHECVHALVNSEWNAAPALMNEGIAVAHQTLPHLGIMEPQWSGTPLDELAAQALEDGTLPELDDLMSHQDFQSHGTGFIYPIAGSFVTSLIERHGYGKIETYFRSSDLWDGADRFRATFLDAFGEELDEAWEVWKEGLAG